MKNPIVYSHNSVLNILDTNLNFQLKFKLQKYIFFHAVVFSLKKMISLIINYNSTLHEEQAHPHHADDGANDLAYRHFLVEQDGRRGDDEDGREGEDGLRDARGGVHRGQ